MSVEQKDKFFAGLYKAIAITMLTLCAFFLKQIHNDFATTKSVVHDLELKVNTIQVDIQYIKERDK
jgi:hypothetical protein